MGDPLTFDIVVILVFLLSLALGISFGFRKTLFLLLAFVLPYFIALAAIVVFVGRVSPRYFTPELRYIALGVLVLWLLLIVRIVFLRNKGSRQVASRFSGAVLGMMLGGWLVVLGSGIAFQNDGGVMLTANGLETFHGNATLAIRTSSLTGPAVFAGQDSLQWVMSRYVGLLPRAESKLSPKRPASSKPRQPGGGEIPIVQEKPADNE